MASQEMNPTVHPGPRGPCHDIAARAALAGRIAAPLQGQAPIAVALRREEADTARAPMAGLPLQGVHPGTQHLPGAITHAVREAMARTAVREAAGPQAVPVTGAPVTGVPEAARPGVPEATGVLPPRHDPPECAPQAAWAGEITNIP